MGHTAEANEAHGFEMKKPNWFRNAYNNINFEMLAIPMDEEMEIYMRQKLAVKYT